LKMNGFPNWAGFDVLGDADGFSFTIKFSRVNGGAVVN
jgi:hypothetical protein